MQEAMLARRNWAGRTGEKWPLKIMCDEKISRRDCELCWRVNLCLSYYRLWTKYLRKVCQPLTNNTNFGQIQSLPKYVSGLGIFRTKQASHCSNNATYRTKKIHNIVNTFLPFFDFLWILLLVMAYWTSIFNVSK